MTAVRRYRRAELVQVIVSETALSPRAIENTRAALATFSPWRLAYFFRSVTGLEVVPHKCGLYYGLSDDDQDDVD